MKQRIVKELKTQEQGEKNTMQRLCKKTVRLILSLCLVTFLMCTVTFANTPSPQPATNDAQIQVCRVDPLLQVNDKQTEAEVVEAAKNVLGMFISHIPVGDESSFGFKSRDEFREVVVGNTPYQMYTRCQDGDFPTNVWRVPVEIANDIRLFITVEWRNDRWIAVELGAAELAKTVTKMDADIIQRKQLQDQQNIHKSIIRDYGTRADYLLIQTIYQDGQQAKTVVADVPEVIQEQNEWCWAGVSASLFDYFDSHVEQCEIAEYTRSVATWHDFGSTNCCSDPSGLCNYWNYSWGYSGSLEDILENMQSRVDIANYGVSNSLSVIEAKADLDNDLPFVIRWGWDSGGGHFVVGHGYDDNESDLSDPYLYYMNPWFGEGKLIALFSWVYRGGGHTWTHTNRLSGVSLVGDVDGDKHLSLADAVIALQLISSVSTVIPRVAADVNGDTQIGLSEAIYILQYLSAAQ